MAKVYKVWIEIEEYDTVDGEGTTLDAPGAAVADFKDYDAAYRFAERLQGTGESLATEHAEDLANDDDNPPDCPDCGDTCHRADDGEPWYCDTCDREVLNEDGEPFEPEPAERDQEDDDDAKVHD